MSNRKIIGRLMVLLVGAVCGLTTGCSSDHTIALNYQPEKTLSVAGHPKVVLVDLADKREAGDAVGLQVGELRGVLGNISAKVFSKDDPVAWVGHALAAELTHAGFEVVNKKSATGNDSPLVVRGEVTKILLAQKGVYWAGSYSTTIHLRLMIQKKGATIFDDTLTATVMRGVSGGRDDNMINELTRALHDLMDEVLPKIIAAAA